MVSCAASVKLRCDPLQGFEQLDISAVSQFVIPLSCMKTDGIEFRSVAIDIFEPSDEMGRCPLASMAKKLAAAELREIIECHETVVYPCFY